MWTLVVVAGIYATLGLAGTLAEALRDSGLDVTLFLLGMVLVAATVLTRGLHARPGGAEIGVMLGVVTVYFMVLARMSFPERSHLIEYGVVAVFAYAALTERASQGRRVPMPALLAIAATALAGAVDELIQVFLPSRVFDPLDILFNTLAAAMAVAASAALGWARGWTERRRQSSRSS